MQFPFLKKNYNAAIYKLPDITSHSQVARKACGKSVAERIFFIGAAGVSHGPQRIAFWNICRTPNVPSVRAATQHPLKVLTATFFALSHCRAELKNV